MRESLLISAKAMNISRNVMDVTANNLANLNTIGYKRDKVYATSFQDMIAKRIGGKNEPYTVPSQIKTATDFSNGELQFTNDKLNVAISGDGFFKVTTPDGDTAYTRRGAFTLNSNRQLSIGNNLVMGSSGPITLENMDISIDEQGEIYDRDNSPIGELAIVNVANKNELRKIGVSLFKSDSAEETEFNGVIRHRYIEKSNVNQANAMIEMLAMMDSLRQFETQQKLVQIQDELNGKAISQIGAV